MLYEQFLLAFLNLTELGGLKFPSYLATIAKSLRLLQSMHTASDTIFGATLFTACPFLFVLKHVAV